MTCQNGQLTKFNPNKLYKNEKINKLLASSSKNSKCLKKYSFNQNFNEKFQKILDKRTKNKS